MEPVREAWEERIPRDWLKLSLGGDLRSLVKYSGRGLSKRTSLKLLSCKFCTRIFDSIPALGGHQSAHRKERYIYAAKRERKPRLQIDNQVTSYSLGIQEHSFVRNPNMEGITWPENFHWDRKSLEEEASDHTEKGST